MGKYKDTYPLTFPIIRGKSEFTQLMYKLMYISFLVQGSDHVGDGHRSLQIHLPASPDLPIHIPDTYPRAWAMGGAGIMMLVCCPDGNGGVAAIRQTTCVYATLQQMAS